MPMVESHKCLVAPKPVEFLKVSIIVALSRLLCTLIFLRLKLLSVKSCYYFSERVYIKSRWKR